jgi:hypothetical protein
MESKVSSKMSTSEVLKMVKRRLNPTKLDDAPLEELEGKLRDRASEKSSSSKVSTKQWVKGKNKDIDRAALGRVSSITGSDPLWRKTWGCYAPQSGSAISGILIEWEPGKPLAIVISDIKGAYDNVWRDGAWAKMADSHVVASGELYDCLIDVTRIKAQYENVKLQVVQLQARSVQLPERAPLTSQRTSGQA